MFNMTVSSESRLSQLNDTFFSFLFSFFALGSLSERDAYWNKPLIKTTLIKKRLLERYHFYIYLFVCYELLFFKRGSAPAPSRCVLAVYHTRWATISMRLQSGRTQDKIEGLWSDDRKGSAY